MFTKSTFRDQKLNNRLKLLFGVGAIFVSIGLNSLMADNVSAASYSTMPRELLQSYTNHLSTSANDPSTGEGLKSERLLIAVYRGAAGGATRVYFNDGNCNSFDFFQGAYSGDNTASPTVGGLNDINGYCQSDPGGGGTGYDHYVELPYNFSASGIFQPGPPDNDPNDQKYVAILRIDLKGGGQSPQFKVTGGNERLSYAGYPYSSRPNSVNEFQYGPGLSYNGGRGEIRMYFAPPCSFDSDNRKVFWRDADSNKDANASPSDPTEEVSFRIFDDTDSDYDMSSAIDAGDDSGANGYEYYFRKGHKYHITFYNVKGGAGAALPNSIQVFYPFSMAGYYNDCDFPVPGWDVEWSGSYIYRTNDSNPFGQGESIGNISDPSAPNSPEPGHNLQYINDSRNKLGGREITNLAWSRVCTRNSDSGNGKCYNASGSSNDRWWSDSYQVVNPSYTNQEDYENYQNNTQVIYYDRMVTVNGGITSNATFSTRGTGVGAGKYVGGPGWVWDTFNVTAADGGTSKCVNASFWPGYGNANKTPGIGTTSWTIPGTESREHAPQLCVNVPYYYNLIPTLTLTPASTGSGTQQGDAIGATGVLTDTSLGNGRQHTNSQAGKVKGVVEFVLPPNTAEPTITGEARVSQEPCTWIGTKGIAVSASNCGRRGEVGHSTDRNNADSGVVNANGFLNINGGRTGAETQNLAVGTKLCYSTYVNHPRHINSDDYNSSLGAGLWSYSTVQCRVIIKAPKVQFENSDVTVGRYRSDGQAHTSGGVTSSCEPPVTAATINTSGAPNAVTTRSNPHYYGSWSEYGAFATGGISGFGSAARPFGIGMDNNNGAKRLMFSNTNSGNFRYGGQCLQNPFNRVTLTNSTNLITQTPQAFDSSGRLRLNELAEKYDASFDRTGYVSRGQNVDIAQPGSDIPMTTVVIRAKSKHATGNSGCPKLRVVASRGTTTDQDTKGICSTSFQSYTYQFYMNTDGPQSINAQMVNDAWSPAAPSTANRDLAIESIEVNGQEVYKYGESHPGVTGQRTGSGSCESAAEGGMFFVADAQSATGGTANYCYGMNIAGINTPVQEDPDHGPYNPLPAKSTITVSANAISSNSYAYGASTAGGCPQLYITVIARSGGTSREDLQHVCRDTGGWQDYTFTTNIGAKGIESVEVGFDPPDAYGGNPSKDLFVRSINVNGTDYPTNRSAAIDLRSNNSYKTTTDSSIPDCTSPTDRISMFAAQDSATSSHCVGIRISNVVNPPPPPPPASVLDGNYDRFKGRNIVIYSQKNSPSDSCSATSDGNLRISQNIAFRKDGYTHITELPRIVLIADCNITIADNVTEVNATLIAGDAIKTCSQQSRVISQCNQRLRVNGAISANRLLLWRTYGADLVDETAAQIPAESFNLGPSQMVAGYSRGTDSAKPKTVHEIDLPPRY